MKSYRFAHEHRGPRRALWIGAGAALGVVMLLAGAYLLGTQASPSSPAVQAAPLGDPTHSSTAPSKSVPQVPTVLAEASASDEPVDTAVAWMRAYWERTALDPTAAAWVDRARPVVGDDLLDEYMSVRNGSSGASWAEFVAKGCASRIEQAAGVIPDEAPRTRTSVHVQVSGQLQTDCFTGTDTPRPAEPVAATVHLTRLADGTWRVDSRLY